MEHSEADKMHSEGQSSPFMSPGSDFKPEQTSSNVQISEFQVTAANDNQGVKKDLRFWVIILSIMVASYILVLDLVSRWFGSENTRINRRSPRSELALRYPLSSKIWVARNSNGSALLTRYRLLRSSLLAAVWLR